MELKKGDRIRQTKRNDRKEFENTTANSVLVYEVTRVNPKTYSLICVDGYMERTGCNLKKDFCTEYTDVYGTTTTWEKVTA